VILPVEAWMDLRRYQPLRDAGATWREIADEVGTVALRAADRHPCGERPVQLRDRRERAPGQLFPLIPLPTSRDP
jgi:hypothetical protein